mmetsp:Transcript_8970/g.40741  ORF Transcript_8970/g.40741 Transcript_8970/m.40741 type:complete len:359 (-) Transcript_8970:473-1549(-)
MRLSRRRSRTRRGFLQRPPFSERRVTREATARATRLGQRPGPLGRRDGGAAVRGDLRSFTLCVHRKVVVEIRYPRRARARPSVHTVPRRRRAQTQGLEYLRGFLPARDGRHPRVRGPQAVVFEQLPREPFRDGFILVRRQRVSHPDERPARGRGEHVRAPRVELRCIACDARLGDQVGRVVFAVGRHSVEPVRRRLGFRLRADALDPLKHLAREPHVRVGDAAPFLHRRERVLVRTAVPPHEVRDDHRAGPGHPLRAVHEDPPVRRHRRLLDEVEAVVQDWGDVLVRGVLQPHRLVHQVGFEVVRYDEPDAVDDVRDAVFVECGSILGDSLARDVDARYNLRAVLLEVRELLPANLKL